MKKLVGRAIAKLKRYYVQIFSIKETMYRFHGIKMKLDFSKAVDKRLFIDGFEKEVIDYYSRVLKKGDVVIDVGANIGIYSLIAGKKIGEEGNVFAFEPALKAFNKLNYHISLNKLNNINAIKKGVSDYTGTAEFNLCEDDAFNSLGDTPMKSIIKTESIEIVSIDDFVKLNQINKIDLIKVDTEGAEFLVFKGAEKTLAKHKPILFFEINPSAANGFDNKLVDLFEFICQNNYTIYEISNNNLVKRETYESIEGNDVVAIVI